MITVNSFGVARVIIYYYHEFLCRLVIVKLWDQVGH
jgi:hypothetical protein